MYPIVFSTIVAFSGSAECASLKTLLVISFLFQAFSNAALIVFASYMHRYIDRRDAAVALSVIHLKERMKNGELRIVETLEKIVDRMQK